MGRRQRPRLRREGRKPRRPGEGSGCNVGLGEPWQVGEISVLQGLAEGCGLDPEGRASGGVKQRSGQGRMCILEAHVAAHGRGGERVKTGCLPPSAPSSRPWVPLGHRAWTGAKKGFGLLAAPSWPAPGSCP